jgi:hypothetical protein
MALPEKLRCFVVMQTFGALESQVSCIKSQQNGTKLGNWMDAEDECHILGLLNPLLFL